MSSGELANIKKQFLAELKRNKKRALVLGVLAMVMIVMFGRLFLLKGGQPSSAVAAGVVPNQLNLPSPTATAADLNELATDAKREQYLKDIDKVIKRDIFMPIPGLFPSQKQFSQAHASIPSEDVIIRDQAKGMSLQSTMLSAVPTAMIDGKVLRAGETINGFQVVEIANQSVSLEKNGVRIVLEMKKEN